MKNIVVVTIFLFTITVSAYTQKYDSESNFKVEHEGNGIKITRYLGKETKVGIPPRIQNLPVISIEEQAFWGCDSLTSITIPDSVTSIGEEAFRYCANLTSVTIGNGVKSIGDCAFSNSGLTSIIIPDNVISIGSNAFWGCDSLANVSIGNSVTSIGDAAFLNCTNLTVINVATGNSAYTAENGILYNKNKTALHTYPTGKTDSFFTIPNSVTIIMYSAFSECVGLTSVTIPDSVTSIESSAFYGCSDLTSVTIPNSVTSIGSSAFNGCTSLTSVIIPNSVTSIKELAFQGCTSLTSVRFQGNISSSRFVSFLNPFPGDLRDKFYATNKTNGTPGIYTRTSGTSKIWTKQ